MRTYPRLFMLSLDAVTTEESKVLATLPNFSRLFAQGTWVQNVNSVFISNTYPAHTSIVTGKHPKDHGVVDNLYFAIGDAVHNWRYDASAVTGPTLYQRAKEEGRTVCSLLYPATGGADIDYHMPEIAQKLPPMQWLRTFLGRGTPGYILSGVLRFGHYAKGKSVASLDDVTSRLAAHTWIKKQPELLLLHLIDTDNVKHYHGPSSQEAKDSLVRHDRRLGEILDTVEDAGMLEETQFLVFSDHGCLPVHTVINPDDFLEETGFAPTDRTQQAAFKAYSHSGGGTAFYQLLDQQHATSFAALPKQLLQKPYVHRLLTKEEMHLSGMDQHFAFGIEAKEGYSFGSSVKGQHGYTLDHPNYQPFYFAKGAGVPAGQVLTGGSILDICPLALELLQLTPWDMDGINRIHSKPSREDYHEKIY